MTEEKVKLAILLNGREINKGRTATNTGNVSQTSVKNLSAMQETQVQSLGREDPLEKEMATPSSILTWKIPWTEEPDLLQSWGRKELDTPEQ